MDNADAGALGLLDRRLKAAPEDPRLRWRKIARPSQLLPPVTDDWRVFYLQGGRGSGKTRSGAQALSEIILADTSGDGQYGVIAPTYRDAWTVMIEGESGLLAALGTTAGEVKHGKSRIVEYAYRSYGEIGLRNGHTVYVDSADDGALRVQGKNLRAAWCGEIGLWQRWDTAWNESLRYAVRQGVSKIIADGTPKASRPARALVRSLIRDEPEHGGVIVRRLRTIDNIKNLSAGFYKAVVGAAKGTRLERQELEGELLDDVANALWLRDQLAAIQVPPVGGEGGIPHLHRAVIGVDPSDGNETSDEQAYTITGLGGELLDTLYVAKNWGGQMAPAAFARKVIIEAVAWNARIVVERNHGGAWLKSTFYQVMKDLQRSGQIPRGKTPAVETVWASNAKRTRAEPVSALYERGVVRHCKMIEPDLEGRPYPVSMVDLEDQMCIAQGELVTTARGDIPVEQVRPGDYALTRCGWQRVYRAGLTGVKDTVTIETGNGSVTCTNDHPVYVSGSGFIRADEVQTGDTLVSCRVPPSTRSSSTRARSTTGTNGTATTRPAGRAAGFCSTGRSGRTSTSRSSRPAGMFITSITTGVITTGPIWPPSRPGTTTASTSPRTARAARSLTRSGSAAPSGKTSGDSGSRASTPALSAGASTPPDRTSRRSTALASAATGLCTDVVRSVRASGARPVYDLSVEGQPEFFAGGLLVHNCTFTGAAGERSPDRLDSLVWACWPFLNASFAPPSAASRFEWAVKAEIEAEAGVSLESDDSGIRRRLKGAHGGMLTGLADQWSIEDFAPDDDDAPQDPGPRGSVHTWR